jgi:hypothetical protein
MATRLTRKTVALGDGGLELAVPGASYADRRAVLAHQRPSSPPPGLTSFHEIHELSG